MKKDKLEEGQDQVSGRQKSNRTSGANGGQGD